MCEETNGQGQCLGSCEKQLEHLWEMGDSKMNMMFLTVGLGFKSAEGCNSTNFIA